jgi:hypothetical protein
MPASFYGRRDAPWLTVSILERRLDCMAPSNPYFRSLACQDTRQVADEGGH